MKVVKPVLLACVLVLLVTGFTGCTGSKILPNQLYDSFSSGDFTANNWVRGGNVLPYLQSEHVYKGKYAVEFSDLVDDETSMMYIDLNVEEGAVIRFYINSFADMGSGSLSFYIDDTLAGRWGMQTGWKPVIRELPAGEHRLKWEYESYPDEPHKVWLDDIMVSNLIPLGEKIEFSDDAFKQLVLAQIGKSGGEAAPYRLSESPHFQDSREEQTLNEHMSLFNNSNYQINKNTRYSSDDVYVNEVSDIEWLSIYSYGWFDYPVADITGIEHFSNLMYLDIDGPKIEDITPLTELENIRYFYLVYSNVEDITPLNNSAEKGSLETLAIMNNMMTSDQLTSESIEALGTWASLKTLFFSSVDITDADVLSNLTNLETLLFWNIPITDISSLSELSKLTRLELAYSPIEDISPLGSLTGLKDLVLEALSLTDISPLESLTTLETLKLWDLPLLETLDGLGPLVNLEDLSLEMSPITDLSPLERVSQLKTLTLYELDISQIETVSNLQSLEDLCLADLAITDLSPIQTLTGLKQLEIGTVDATDITALSDLTALEFLSLYDMDISDISPLSSLTALEKIYIRDTNLKDITPVKHLTNVFRMYLNRNLIEDITPIVEGLINTLERLDIRDNQLDLTPGSEDMENIKKLIDAGVGVDYE